MNGNYAYSHSQHPHHRPYDAYDAFPQTTATDSVQEAHQLLAAYPYASATPSSHVARHLGNLSVTAAPPSFMQPYSSLAPTGHYHQPRYPQYSEYAPEINHLASTSQSGYWERTRNDAVHHLASQAPYYHDYQPPPQWPPPHSRPSTYQPNSFAQSIIQHTSPAAAYPTPPPPTFSASSSSLAGALGPPPAPAPPPSMRPAKPVYTASESPAFFNNFLSQTPAPPAPPVPVQAHRPPHAPEKPPSHPNRPPQQPPRPHQPKPFAPSSSLAAENNAVLMSHSSRRPPVEVNRTPHHVKVQPMVEESPDPLAITPTADRMQSPRKRKHDQYLESPTPKRVQIAAPVPPPQTPRRQVVEVVITTSPPKKHTPAHRPSFKMTPYVEVPMLPKGYFTPTSQRKAFDLKGKGRAAEDDYDDLGGFGESSPTRPPHRSSVMRSSGKRATGDRDDRAPIEKLFTLLEDIFEAEDGVSPETEPQDLPSEWFSAHSPHNSPPCLHPNVIRKLTTHITKVARPSKRHRLNMRENGTVPGTPRHKGRMADVDTTTLSRILKVLDRSVRAGEGLEPFKGAPTAGVPQSPQKSKAKKGGKKTQAQEDSRRSASQTPGAEGDNNDAMDVDDSSADQHVTEKMLDSLTRTLEIARDSILAADSCIALLSSDRLPKQLYSEELITACLETVKNHLSKILYPFVEATPEGRIPAILRHVLQSHNDSAHRRLLSEIFQAISSILPRINDLVCADSMAMSEAIIIQAVYIAIGPFFVCEAHPESEGKSKKASAVISALGSSAMRSLRLDALSLIRSIFANHEGQRPWIIEEILSSLIKLSDTKQRAGQFRLRDGKSIRTVSALLMQLVQTSAHDVRIEARSIRKAREQAVALRRQESLNEKTKEPWLDDHDKSEIRLYASGLESATKAARTIIAFLTQRSGRNKVTKNSNEAEYRAIFDNFISDLLAVLFWPEWPAASLILDIICKLMVQSLEGKDKSAQDENNAMKMVALDHLGVIAAHMKTSKLKFQETAGTTGLAPLDEVVGVTDLKRLERLVSAHRELQANLSKRSSEDQAFDSARELTAVTWGHELASSLQHCEKFLEEDGQFSSKAERGKYMAFATTLKMALRDLWSDGSGDVFDIGSSQEEVVRMDRLAEEIGTIQNMCNSFKPILVVVLNSLDAPAVFIRTKALRALGQIVTSDPSTLSLPNVRKCIVDHLHDNSPAVRDAAVELVGRFIIDSPAFASDYYQKIADRIADTGLGVRKRVIKLLKSYYSVTDDRATRIDICTRITLRILDEDDTVKDLAIKTMEELWFPSTTPDTKERASSQDKTQLLNKVAIIMGVSSQFKDRQSPLEDMLHRIMAEKSESETPALHQRYVEICEALIDGLVDASDLPDFTVLNCVRTIYLFTSAYPAVLSGSNASTLLPYLKNATTPEEQVTSDYLLRIFRASIPHLPKTAAKFGQELQLALQPMILKPSSAAGVQGLQETVACMCAVVQHITHEFNRVVALLRSCNGRLQQHIKKQQSQPMNGMEQRALVILLFITSLLCEHCDFDALRAEHEKWRADLDSVSKGPINEHIYFSLLSLYDKHSEGALRTRLLQCLGFLFRAQPMLMTAEPSAKIMDAIFASPEEESRGRLLKILQDFLIAEAAKHSANEKVTAKSKSAANKVNMEELIGNTDGFADSGVSSAIVQRYLDQILEAVLSQNMQIQSSAVDILTFTIRQGLAHPLQSFPVIVALETSPSSHLSSRASALHAILHSKHTSLLNARYVMSARASFDYQKRIAPNDLRGYRRNPGPVALLQPWYTLVREKRVTRQEFLRALVKVFDVEVGKSSQDDVDFTRYMVENFCAFEYKTQEEVMTVIKALTAVLSTSGMQLVELVSPSHLLAQLHAPSGSQPVPPLSQPAPSEPQPPPDGAEATASEAQPASLPPPDLGVIRSTVIVAMIMLLKSHLKIQYGLSEEKCAKFVVGKKSAVGDRPATRKHENPVEWKRLPFATAPVLTSEDGVAQRETFLEIWSEDGVTAEPEDDMP